MIIFNIDIKAVAPDCHPSGEAPLVQASRWWGCSDVDLSTYGDYALTAIDNVIVGVYRINGWMHDPHRDNRVALELEELPAEHPLRGWISLEPPLKPNPRNAAFQYLSVKNAVFGPAQLIDHRSKPDPVHDEVHLLSYL